MYKMLPVLALIMVCSGCTKNQKTACGTQACTDVFASVGVNFKDKTHKGVNVADYSVTNLRTGQKLTNVISATADFVPGYRVVADDSNLIDLSTDGDELKVSATNPTTHEILTATFKVAGGCNCHVAKKAGPDSIVFKQ